jgi:hypothetical protein
LDKIIARDLEQEDADTVRVQTIKQFSNIKKIYKKYEMEHVVKLERDVYNRKIFADGVAQNDDILSNIKKSILEDDCEYALDEL